MPAVTSEFVGALLNAARDGDLGMVDTLLAGRANAEVRPRRVSTWPPRWPPEGNGSIVDALLARRRGEGGGQ